MKKSLFDSQSVEAVVKRLTALSPEDTARWGSMDAGKMLQHCRIVNETILYGRKTDKKPSFKENVLKIIFINLFKRIPKNANSPQIIKQAAARQKSIVFDDEKNRLIQTVKAFYKHKEPIAAAHPVFGPMNTKDWGTFAWVHLNHHLTQFGK